MSDLQVSPDCKESFYQGVIAGPDSTSITIKDGVTNKEAISGTGLLVGDEILAVNGKPINGLTVENWQKERGELQANLTIRRNGMQITIPVFQNTLEKLETIMTKGLSYQCKVSDGRSIPVDLFLVSETDGYVRIDGQEWKKIGKGKQDQFVLHVGEKSLPQIMVSRTIDSPWRLHVGLGADLGVLGTLNPKLSFNAQQSSFWGQSIYGLFIEIGARGTSQSGIPGIDQRYRSLKMYLKGVITYPDAQAISPRQFIGGGADLSSVKIINKDVQLYGHFSALPSLYAMIGGVLFSFISPREGLETFLVGAGSFVLLALPATGAIGLSGANMELGIYHQGDQKWGGAFQTSIVKGGIKLKEHVYLEANSSAVLLLSSDGLVGLDFPFQFRLGVDF